VLKKHAATTSLAGIRADGATFIAFPVLVQGIQWLIDESWVCVEKHIPVRLTVAGAAQARLTVNSAPSCFPLNCGM
jgi:hypothetical protein